MTLHLDMTYLSTISDDPEKDAKSELKAAIEKLTQNCQGERCLIYTNNDTLKY
jgi:hypothetical protein